MNHTSADLKNKRQVATKNVHVDKPLAKYIHILTWTYVNKPARENTTEKCAYDETFYGSILTIKEIKKKHIIVLILKSCIIFAVFISCSEYIPLMETGQFTLSSGFSSAMQDWM